MEVKIAQCTECKMIQERKANYELCEYCGFKRIIIIFFEVANY